VQPRQLSPAQPSCSTHPTPHPFPRTTSRFCTHCPVHYHYWVTGCLTIAHTFVTFTIPYPGCYFVLGPITGSCSSPIVIDSRLLELTLDCVHCSHCDCTVVIWCDLQPQFIGPLDCIVGFAYIARTAVILVDLHTGRIPTRCTLFGLLLLDPVILLTL